ncbi:ABC transporter ATP-binding protein [Loigolactobacillus zhaoyuanensis]|uniref:ABC transporter ATP-binding protein n=1 Tax=Loigolactobacillus zhaoyuanensis TaxID=2486017 RepID=UPI001CDD4CD4|nr:ATP-binding cassette domain-containing protein [Loigolactobacillus zhaoyuanensis]
MSKAFATKQVLQAVSLDLNQGEIVALLGVSGSGKTTLFDIIAGLLPTDSGQIKLNDSDITGQTGQVSYMLQKDLLLPFRTIAGNMALPLQVQGMTKKAALAKVQPYFATFGLAGTENQYPSSLSGGMRQRAALLRTYLFGKQVALLDEPFSALDEITKREMHRWYLQMMTQIDLTTLLVTHDIDEALVLADRIYVFGGQPAQIAAELQLPPRAQRDAEFELTSQFLTYKRQILELLAQ